MGTVRQGQGVSPSVARSRQRTTRPVDCRLQLILIGDRGVGKTSLLERFTGGAFAENCKSTVGVDFKIRTIDVGDKKIRLQIWDTAGQERFNSITSAYYRNAKGILIVYDLTKRETFEELGKWMKMVDKYASEDADLLLVGNKLDREMEREVRRDEGEKFARQYCGMRFCESSAKDNSNVDDLFHRLVEDVVRKMPLAPAFPHELSASYFSLQQDRPEHPSNPPARRCC